MRPTSAAASTTWCSKRSTATIIKRIRSEVEDALRQFEARIDVLEVTVDENATSEGKLLVELEYRVRRTNQIGNLVFPFFFREGGRP